MRFSTGAIHDARQPRRSLAPSEIAAASLHVRNRVPVSPEGFYAGIDEEIAALTPQSPYDSQYEMTAVLGGDPDDSQTELPAFTGETDLSDETDLSGEIEAARPFETASSEFLTPVPWYFNFIDSWGRLLFYLATGFATASLAVLGFLLVRALVAGQIMSSSVTALIIGCVGTIAFLLISLSATALTVLLVDLARNVRMLIQQADRNPVSPVAPENQDRTRLSQPVA
jgi:hypothetical protein